MHAPVGDWGTTHVGRRRRPERRHVKSRFERSLDRLIWGGHTASLAVARERFLKVEWPVTSASVGAPPKLLYFENA